MIRVVLFTLALITRQHTPLSKASTITFRHLIRFTALILLLQRDSALFWCFEQETQPRSKLFEKWILILYCSWSNWDQSAWGENQCILDEGRGIKSCFSQLPFMQVHAPKISRNTRLVLSNFSKFSPIFQQLFKTLFCLRPHLHRFLSSHATISLHIKKQEWHVLQTLLLV